MKIFVAVALLMTVAIAAYEEDDAIEEESEVISIVGKILSFLYQIVASQNNFSCSLLPTFVQHEMKVDFKFRSADLGDDTI